jgi:catechol 2,3-dioxygenase-like lactoylglutathione lyase family enzyme
VFGNVTRTRPGRRLLLVDEYAVPILPSRDLEETLGFYARLGFESRGAPPDKYGYVVVGRGSIELHFYDEPKVDPLTTSSSCYVHVSDADNLHAEWERTGVEHDPATGSRLMPPWNTDYGLREFALVDKSGNLVRLGSPLAA